MYESKIKKNTNHIEMSTKLQRIISLKYDESNMKVNIMSYIKEYISICIKYENHFHNTKYNVLYILKTHKKYKDLFNKLSQTKSYEQMNETLNEIED